MPVLGVHRQIIKDGYAGSLAAGAGGRRNGDESFQRARNGPALTDGRVDVFEQIGGIATVKVGSFGRCPSWSRRQRRQRRRNRPLARRRWLRGKTGRWGSTRIRSKSAKRILLSSSDCKAVVTGGRGAQQGIDEDQRVVLPQVRQFRADFASDSRTESDRGAGHLECVFCFHEAPSLTADKSVADGYSKIKKDVILRSSTWISKS
jgi:hypothetical protein